MPPDIEIDVLKLNKINAKNAPLATAQIAMNFSKTVHIGEPGYTTILTVSDTEAAQEILKAVPDAKILG